MAEEDPACSANRFMTFLCLIVCCVPVFILGVITLEILIGFVIVLIAIGMFFYAFIVLCCGPYIDCQAEYTQRTNFEGGGGSKGGGGSASHWSDADKMGDMNTFMGNP